MRQIVAALRTIWLRPQARRETHPRILKSSDDRTLLAQLDADDTLYRDVVVTFQGRMRWLNALGWIVGFLLFWVALPCAWRFWIQTDTRGMLPWGGGAGLAISGLALAVSKLVSYADHPAATRRCSDKPQALRAPSSGRRPAVSVRAIRDNPVLVFTGS